MAVAREEFVSPALSDELPHCLDELVNVVLMAREVGREVVVLIDTVPPKAVTVVGPAAKG
jgi:hypothetical protein